MEQVHACPCAGGEVCGHDGEWDEGAGGDHWQGSPCVVEPAGLGQGCLARKTEETGNA